MLIAMVLLCPALQKNVALLEKGVQSNQQRLIGRVLRNNLPLRMGVAPKTLSEGIKQFTAADSPIRQQALKALAEVGGRGHTQHEPDEACVRR